MKTLFFLFSLMVTPAWATEQGCEQTTSVYDDVDEHCAVLHYRCPGDEQAGTRGGGDCKGDSIEFRVGYLLTCGNRRTQRCGSDLSAWTKVKNNCLCGGRKQVSIRMRCDHYSRDNNAYLAIDSCYY